ncbi:hypothetical protein [Sphingomonas sp. Leaf38]|uniref:hypothetical protein n=2 Tax=unclassified Sphingomonas TaxID=196159 RepID=UPI0006F26ECA|nr:hypothetical protein [Sphingomonas sp. Leaf38]
MYVEPMVRSYNFAAAMCIVAQGIAVCIGSAVLIAWPPRHGEYLLVPVGANAVANLLPMAFAGHALLIGAGPLPHSYVVRGDRAQLAGVMMAHGVVMVAASAVACGETAVAA